MVCFKGTHNIKITFYKVDLRDLRVLQNGEILSASDLLFEICFQAILPVIQSMVGRLVLSVNFCTLP